MAPVAGLALDVASRRLEQCALVGAGPEVCSAVERPEKTVKQRARAVERHVGEHDVRGRNRSQAGQDPAHLIVGEVVDEFDERNDVEAAEAGVEIEGIADDEPLGWGPEVLSAYSMYSGT